MDSHRRDAGDQDEVIAFLSSPAAFADHPRDIERHETHGALVFLAGSQAFKIKRAVAFEYMDFSTLDRRRRMLERELRINRRYAPGLYLGTVAVTRQPDGTLALGGSGQPVEYALEMHRFSQSDLLGQLARRRALTPSQAVDLADTVFDGHRRQRSEFALNGDIRFAAIVETIGRQLADHAAVKRPLHLVDVEQFRHQAAHQLQRASECLRRRGEAGCVRRCHGDLHLNNIVMLEGRPTPFDAIEFSDDLATIDTLYDLAYLLMDLEHVGERRLANIIANRYLQRSGSPIDLMGLQAMPLFLGLRGAIRAMTSAQRAMLAKAAPEDDSGDAHAYLAGAIRHLGPTEPRLLAVGGYSGTGKTTLAAELAHRLLPAPGAIHIRTDLERKSLFDVSETERLPAECYTAEATRRVYAQVFGKARLALAAGYSVVIDASFLSEAERSDTEKLAAAAGVPFSGLWLTAAREILLERVAARKGDASDATADVVLGQLASRVGEMRWHILDAGSDRAAVLNAALLRLGSA